MLAEIYCSLALLVAPQDTLRVSMDGAEKMFAEKNLLILAQSYQVEATKALEIQARLYPNAQLSGEINAIDRQHEKYFNVGPQGQKAFQIEQLILLGGKRKKEMELARQNSMIASLEFEDLLRNLKLELHNTLYDVYFDQSAVRGFNQQLTLLDSIIVSYDRQAKKGNIPYKEVIRLKSIYIRINNEKTNFIKEILEGQKKLQVLLQSPGYVAPEINVNTWAKFERQHPIDSLVNIALDLRPDYKISKANINYANLNLQYQRRLAVPDVSLGGDYDQRGGAFVNQVGLMFSMPLPLTNRNQGNIKAAEHQAKAVVTLEQQAKSEITAHVTNSWLALNRSVQEYAKARTMYNADFTTVFNGVSENFQKRNITLLEFVDFFESYNETVINMNHIERQVALSAEQLNYSIAYPLY
ncbi:MAG TPA: TolC family protein [Cyclobacteriaceae bacterium]